MGDPEYRTVFRCTRCAYIYLESDGDHTAGIPPGMPWASLPDDWACPHCGVNRSQFEPLDIEQPA